MHALSVSLRTRLLLLIVGTFCVLIGAVAYFAHLKREEDLAAARAQVETVGKVIAEEQKDVIDFAAQLSAELSEFFRVPGFDLNRQCRPLLAGLLASNPRLANLSIVSTAGDVLCYASPAAGPVNVSDRSYFKNALASPELVIDQPIVGRLSAKWGLPVARAMRDADGKAIGVLLVLIDLEWVNRTLEKQQLPEGSTIGLVSPTGIVLARHPDPLHLVGKDVSGSDAFKSILARKGVGTALTRGVDGIERIAGYVRFAETSAGPIYFWVAVPKDTVTAGVERTFNWTIAGASLLLGALLAAVWIFGERWLLRPVSVLAATTRRLAAGDHNARTGLRYTRDEVGQLARAFDEMAVALVSKSELLRLNRALKVLSESNRALVRARDEEELLGETCRILTQTGGFPMARAGVLEGSEAPTLRLVAQSGTNPAPVDDPTQTALRTGTPQQNESCAALPLKEGPSVFGALTIHARGPGAFSGDEIELLEELAGDLSFGIAALRSKRARERAEQEREQYLRFFQLSNDPMAIADPYGCFLRVNPALLRLTGYDEDELVTKPFLDFVVPEDRERTAEEMRLQVSKRPSLNFENRYRCKDGRVVLLSWTAFFDKQGGVTYATARDITELRRAEEQVHASEERLRLQVERMPIGLIVWGPDFRAQTWNPAAERIFGFSAAEAIGKHPYDLIVPGPAQPHVDAIWRRLQEGDITAHSINDNVTKDGRAIVCEWNNTPLRRPDGAVIGVLAMVQDITERRQAQLRIERSMEGTIAAMAATVEIRDPYTAGHQRRVAALAVAIGREMKLPEDRVRALHLAGLVHDLGKIQVPAELLSKPTRLTPIEMELMKGHSQAGHEILKGIDFPWPIAQMVLQHHERIDGSGYPGGLKGDEILLEARILCVADVVEAMASHRPYRPALGLEAALKEVSSHAGKSYDADVVAACARLFGEGRFAFPPAL